MIKKLSLKKILVTYLFILFFAVPTVLSINAYAKPKPGYTELTQIKALSYNKISLKWKNTSNATHYKIYYKPSGTSKWTNLTMVSGTSYVHTANNSKPIIVGQKYDYTVQGYNSKYKTSGSYNKTGKTVYTKPAKVKLKKSATLVDEYNKKIKIHWHKSYGSDYYKIYRKSKSSPKYRCIATVKASNLSYIDKKCKAGEQYTYTVRGYYSKTRSYGNYDKKGITVRMKYLIFPDKYPDGQLSEREKEKMAQLVIKYTNEERAKVGVQPLIYNASLQKLAMARAKELEISFSHTRPNGKPFYTIADDFNLGANALHGENLTGGTLVGPDSAVDAWCFSTEHYKNMTNNRYTHIGVGCYLQKDGNMAWVQIFGSDKIDKLLNISFKLNGGTCDITSMRVPYGKEFIVKRDFPVPKRKGYKFLGWGSFESSIPLKSVRVTLDGEYFTALWEKL